MGEARVGERLRQKSLAVAAPDASNNLLPSESRLSLMSIGCC